MSEATKCQSCGAPAIYVTKWQTPAMHAPAFWYDCEEDVGKTRAVVNANANILASEERIYPGGMVGGIPRFNAENVRYVEQSNAETAPPEYDFCSWCKEHAEFVTTDVEGEWRSTCCDALAVPVDVELEDR